MSQGDFVRLHLALALGRKIGADIGDIRRIAQVGAAYHTVEIHRRRGADSKLKVGHLGCPAQDLRQSAGDDIRAFQRGPLRRVDKDLQLVFVVERQHLQGDGAHARQQGRAQE